MNKAIGYIRVSTDKETQANSLLVQPETIKKHAAANGLKIVDIVTDEESAYKVPFFERAGGKKILQMIKAGKVQHIIGAKLDRIFRNTQDGLATDEWFKKKNISLHIIDSGGTMNTNTAMGYMFFTMALAMAQFEPMRTSERTKEAMSKLRKNGKKTGTVPYGFDEVGGRLVENSDELDIVREIRGHAINEPKLSLTAIAADLNARAVPTKNGKKWHPSTVRNILRRPEAP